MDYKALVKKELSKKRYEHSVRVAETAVKLAIAHGEDQSKAEIAGLLHDYCKEMPKAEIIRISVDNHLLTSEYDLLMPQVLHGAVASVVLKDKGIIHDEQILQAIRFHTTGHKCMDMLAKIIFIADYIEPGRTTPNIDDLMDIALTNLDKCTVEIIDRTSKYLISEHRLIHEDMVKLRNEIISKE